ncbi:MAG TPA: Crp/Fnr family transcriptional regulator [Solirubrobacteraceae bacterium]|nr:Crp/Fnr family transcriptional regulator [Solirubrobacteraceae bacterium]
MVSPDRVPLLDAKLELTPHLPPEERAELASVALPVVDVSRGTLAFEAILQKHNAFAATVLDGVLVHALQIGEHSGVQLLGPGDLLVESNTSPPSWLESVEFRAPGPVRLAVLGEEFLAVARRAPHVIPAVYECLADQMQRLNSQLVICQLPRVDERVLAILWLLAESWGHVTPGGVRLPMTMTHETLGALVGARRPTVTLALRKLSENGSIVRQDSGWLLLESPPEPAGSPKELAPELSGITLSRFAAGPDMSDPSIRFAGLRETVRELREQHAYDRQQTSEQLKRIRTARVRMNAARARISQDALMRRRPPSS